MKNALGRHVLCEAYGCDPKVLDDKDQVENIMVQAALHAGAEVREVAFHKFAPQGVSGVKVISNPTLLFIRGRNTSMPPLTFTCGDTVDP